MSRMEGFDAYADKKMRVEYDKLFEKRYPFVERISNGFRHSMADLLKIYLEPPPSGRAPSVTPHGLREHDALWDSARWLIPLTLVYGAYDAFRCYALAHPFDFCLWGIVIPLGVMPWLLPLADE
ncbi:hypothetical protein Tco_1560393, partial [Tanacetum coccineum]